MGACFFAPSPDLKTAKSSAPGNIVENHRSADNKVVKRQDGTENTYPMNCTIKPADAGAEVIKKAAPRK
ncbi:MAG: hypothetical protein A2521_12845 [Deltaproteobacteria bacterium RIFOXYD12_FULL_57_12]|nr:MAG: hypothetical protein A2521_12845 [Deltaproteobacteria bacterium RIFOXYD12_FULL_57_12]